MGSPSPLQSAPQVSRQSPVQRAIISRPQHVRRPKAAPNNRLHGSNEFEFSNHSPYLQPTPPSQQSSPTSTSPGVFGQGVMTPPSSDIQAQLEHQHHLHQPQPAEFNGQPHVNHPATYPTSQPAAVMAMPTMSMAGPMSGPGTIGASFYPTPFQNHIDQLGKLTRPFPSPWYERAMFVLD